MSTYYFMRLTFDVVDELLDWPIPKVDINSAIT